MLEMSELPWFSTKAQIIQTVVCALALLSTWGVSVYKGWQPVTRRVSAGMVVAVVSSAAIAMAILAPVGTMVAVLLVLLGLLAPVTYAALGTGPHFKRGNPFLDYCGTEDLGCVAFQDLGSCSVLVARVENKQIALTNSANNVRATIQYKHADKRNSFWVKRAQWFFQGATCRHDDVTIAGGQSALLAVVLQRVTPDLPGDGELFALDGRDKYLDLLPGHWTVKVHIDADNARPVVLLGSFTILHDAAAARRHLRLDHPVFKLRRPLSLRW